MCLSHLIMSKLEEREYKSVLSALARGYKYAKTRLAWFKLAGVGGCEADEEGAVALLEERVKEGIDAEAMWMLGVCCEFGRGIEQDRERALKLYEESSKGSNIGRILLSTRGCYKLECLLKLCVSVE